jgi:hypothetical protein
MGQLVSGYLDFAERQAEKELPMTMDDWANYLDRILTSTGEQPCWMEVVYPIRKRWTMLLLSIASISNVRSATWSKTI